MLSIIIGDRGVSYTLYGVVEASKIHYNSTTILQCILKQAGEGYSYSGFKTLCCKTEERRQEEPLMSTMIFKLDTKVQATKAETWQRF